MRHKVEIESGSFEVEMRLLSVKVKKDEFSLLGITYVLSSTNS
jgi:hypothetical protein